MTDWLPWGAVVMVAVFGTLESLVRALAKANPALELGATRRWSRGGGVATLFAWLMYIVFQEKWIWY